MYVRTNPYTKERLIIKDKTTVGFDELVKFKNNRNTTYDELQSIFATLKNKWKLNPSL